MFAWFVIKGDLGAIFVLFYHGAYDRRRAVNVEIDPGPLRRLIAFTFLKSIELNLSRC